MNVDKAIQILEEYRDRQYCTLSALPENARKRAIYLNELICALTMGIVALSGVSESEKI